MQVMDQNWKDAQDERAKEKDVDEVLPKKIGKGILQIYILPVLRNINVHLETLKNQHFSSTLLSYFLLTSLCPPFQVSLLFERQET